MRCVTHTQHPWEQRDKVQAGVMCDKPSALAARNRTVSSEQQDELGRRAERLGLSRGAAVYAPWRKVCPHRWFGVL